VRVSVRHFALLLAVLLISGCTTVRGVKCAQDDPAPELPVIVHYAAEWDDGDGASAQILRFAAWSDGAIVTVWFDERDGLTYFVGRVPPGSVRDLVEEIASLGIFDLPDYQFGIDHGDEEGVGFDAVLTPSGSTACGIRFRPSHPHRKRNTRIASF
jgi:hypothetical protein